MSLNRILQFAGWPTAVGTIIALLALLVFPQLRGQSNTATPIASNENLAPVSYADAVTRAAPAVVNIYTQKKVLERDPRYTNTPYASGNTEVPLKERLQNTLGSGVIVDTRGFIITNNHVINGADQIFVLLNDGRNSSAQLVGIDTENDLAVLKIELDKLHAIIPKISGNIRVGDVVLAIGNPLGVGQSVSQGIVSATGRWNLGISNNENFIQTDAAINLGNSGGALIDAKGNLVGINTAQLDETVASTGISFAIPADMAMNSLNQIIQYGEIRHGWLGLAGRLLSPEQVELFGQLGIIVTDIEHGSPAAESGFKVGDIITKINGVAIKDGHSAEYLIRNLQPGKKVNFQILRNEKRTEIEATMGVAPANRSKT